MLLLASGRLVDHNITVVFSQETSLPKEDEAASGVYLSDDLDKGIPTQYGLLVYRYACQQGLDLASYSDYG